MSYANKTNKTCIFLLFIFLTFCIASQTSAVMIGLSTRELTKKSLLIIMGDVKEIKSKWSMDKKAIFTVATVGVSEIIKGRIVTKKIKVTYEGGEVDGIGMRISDAVSLNVGERVILFLNPEQDETKEGTYKIFGKAQGKYTIRTDNIASKSGFSIASEEDLIDNNLPVNLLIEKIKEIENE